MKPLDLSQLPAIKGSGGGGKKGGASSNSKNTLQSKATIRLQWLLGEGEIDSVDQPYFDGTPLIALDGTKNFKGVDWSYNTGTPDQEYLTGNPILETPHDVNHTKVTKSNGQVVRTITEDSSDSCRVIVSLPALFKVKDGALKPTSLSYQVKVQAYGGSYEIVATNTLKSQKSSSEVQFAHEFDLPKGGSPWSIAVERLTDDSDDDNLQNDLYWDSYYTIIRGRFTYPNSAIVEMKIDTEDFGSSVPTITFGGKWLKTPIPTNYDPIARTYTGIWDGTFNIAWHRNPAWVLWDVITNDRYGLGEFIDADKVDKWSFYQIGQYCDELVPDGFGGMEPRYSFDGSMSTQAAAYDVLRKIANVFRGVTYWALGQVYAVADMPADPEKMFTTSNTVPGDNGSFEYSGTAISARHSTALVAWNDPDDHSKPATELVINDEMLQRYGWRQASTELVGTQVRGQANRFGLWVLDTEQHETETVNFQTSTDAIDLKPFDIISIADPNKAGIRIGGRIVEALSDRLTVTLDSAFEPSLAEVYYLMLMMPDGTMETKEIASFTGGNSTVILAEQLSAIPLVNATWEIKGADVNPRQYRVMVIEEDQPHLFSITAIQHDPTKYDRVELGLQLDPIQYSRPTKFLMSPTNVTSVEHAYFENGTPRSVLTVSWTPGADFLSLGYNVSAITPNGYVDYGDNIQSTSVDATDVVPGDYEFSIMALGYNGLKSQPVTFAVTATGWDGSPPNVVTSLQLVNGTSPTVFATVSPKFTWVNDLSSGVLAYARNVVKLYNDATGDLLRTEYLVGTEYTYSLALNTADSLVLGEGPASHIRIEVAAEDVFGRVSAFAPLSVSSETVSLTIADVDDFKISVLADLITLSWTGIVSSDPIYYILKFSPVLTGATWGSSATLLENITATSVQLPTRAGSYLIKAARSDSIKSTNAAIITTTANGPQLNAVEQFIEEPDWTGTKTDVAIIDSTLQLDGTVSLTGSYVSSQTIDLGNVYLSRITPILVSQGFNTANFISSWIRLSDVESLDDTDVSQWSTTLEMRTTDDDPSGTPTWSDWREATVSDVSARAYQMRLMFESAQSNISVKVSKAELIIDMPDRVIGENDLTVTTAGLDVLFDPAYKALKGLSISAQGLATGDYYEITSKDRTGFSIIFKDSSGAPIERTLDYVAVGYGRIMS